MLNDNEATYEAITSGKCDDEVGRSGIYDEYECVRAIDITQYSLSSGPSEGGSSVVDGCSVRSYDGLALSLLPSFLNPKGTCVRNNCLCSKSQPCFCRSSFFKGPKYLEGGCFLDNKNGARAFSELDRSGLTLAECAELAIAAKSDRFVLQYPQAWASSSGQAQCFYSEKSPGLGEASFVPMPRKDCLYHGMLLGGPGRNAVFFLEGTPAPPYNIALGKPTRMSSSPFGDYGGGDKAVDGDVNPYWSGGSIAHSTTETDPYLIVEFEATYRIDKIRVFNRQDCCADRLFPLTMTLLNETEVTFTKRVTSSAQPVLEIDFSGSFINTNMLKLLLQGDNRVINVAEIEVYGSLLDSTRSVNLM
eukprot:gene12929-5962_t